MDKLFYPAVFQVEEEGGFSISFPDVEGCLTQGENIEEGYRMAYDALGLSLSYYEDKKISFPKPSEPNKINIQQNQFVMVIQFDMQEYRRKNDSKAVKKTLSIPSWLNEAAMAQNINFSQVLKEALVYKIDSNNKNIKH